jgi:tetratricopeptide (TPR) repeat protein
LALCTTSGETGIAALFLTSFPESTPKTWRRIFLSFDHVTSSHRHTILPKRQKPFTVVVGIVVHNSELGAFQQTAMTSSIQESLTSSSWSQAALSLIKIGGGFLCRKDLKEALDSFEAAQAFLTLSTSNEAWSIAVNCLHIGKTVLESIQEDSEDDSDAMSYPPDLYEEDECDVGPRIMGQAITTGDFASGKDIPLLEAIILFNKGLVYHKMGNLSEAKKHYEVVAYTIQTMLSFTFGNPSTTFLLLAMRSHNNLGLISYLERKEGVAAASFEAAIQFGRLLASLSKTYQLEYTIALSNWCRVNWMRGDMSDRLYTSVKEILCIRVAVLPRNHVDIAAAHYNVAVAEYARRNRLEAVTHLRQHQTLAKHISGENQNGLSPIPALIFLLLIQNEDKNDSTAQDLVRGLQALQEKRQDLGPNSLEVASVLNYVGTLLFHQEDFENALVFFREELRLEDMKVETAQPSHLEGNGRDETTSISVTCNNIGRILQELGKYEEAISYYYKALKPEYGDVGDSLFAPYKMASVATKSRCDKNFEAPFSTSAANLYSTVWYNLGLIHDKLGAYGEAITAFEMSLRLRKVLLGDTHSDIACLLYNIGVLQMEQQRLDDASASFREALSIRRVTTAGRLNDRHVIKTLGKLAALHRDKGNLKGALEAASEIMSIQEVTPEYDETTRMKELGATLRFIAELHHAEGSMDKAVSFSLACVIKLRAAADVSAEQQALCLDLNLEPLIVRDRVANAEQLVLTLLLLGSLYHESGEPLQAEKILQEASRIVENALTFAMMCPFNTTLTSIQALYEVTKMLGTCRCAPMA